MGEANLPEIDYDYDTPSEYDEGCGTFGIGNFSLPNVECPSHFVCDVSDASTELAAFSSCIDSMDCAMMAGMTTGISAGSEIALFLHQMIPHHQNAVNMAKALLFTDNLECSEILEETSDCELEVILREIINAQNGQIQSMIGMLDSWEYPQTDDCEVIVQLDEDHHDHDVTASAASLPLAGSLAVATFALLLSLL